MAISGYDIIGDIHGHGDELITLLQHLDYYNSAGAFQHASRQALFLGDLIDRGTQNRLAVDTVRKMCAAGSAQCIMGNHEFNAISFHTKQDGKSANWIRERSDKNLVQHSSFLHEYMHPDLFNREQILADTITFFRSLPVFLDLGDIRLIHSCWHPGHLRALAPRLTDDNLLDDVAIQEGHTPGCHTFEAVDVLLKGHEVDLPDGHSYTDNYGIVRHRTRTKWWLQEPANFRTWTLDSKYAPASFEELAVPNDGIIGYSEDAPPLFIGHYWRKGTPSVLASNVACVDYSIGKGRASGGKLVAYRWSGEQKLKDEHFAYLT